MTLFSYSKRYTARDGGERPWVRALIGWAKSFAAPISTRQVGIKEGNPAFSGAPEAKWPSGRQAVHSAQYYDDDSQDGAMLKLTLNQDEYVTIGGDIVVQITRIGGNQVELAVQADRSVPIVRGEVLERQGGERPACLAPPLRKKRFHPADGPVGI